MFTENEVKIIRNEVSFCKSELIDRIKDIMENLPLNFYERQNMEKLLENVIIGEYDYIEPDFTGEEVIGYYINIAEGTAKKAVGSGFCFGYDNERHEIVLDSMCWIDCD